MNESTEGLGERIEAIQASKFKAAFVLAGGGTGILQSILSHPGASRFVLDAQIPYSTGALEYYINQTPKGFCSVDTVFTMAAAAFDIAKRYESENPLSIACTAALATTRVRRGKDHAFISIMSTNFTELYEIDLVKAPRDDQEDELSYFILRSIEHFIRVVDNES